MTIEKIKIINKWSGEEYRKASSEGGITCLDYVPRHYGVFYFIGKDYTETNTQSFLDMGFKLYETFWGTDGLDKEGEDFLLLFQLSSSQFKDQGEYWWSLGWKVIDYTNGIHGTPIVSFRITLKDFWVAFDSMFKMRPYSVEFLHPKRQLGFDGHIILYSHSKMEPYSLCQRLFRGYRLPDYVIQDLLKSIDFSSVKSYKDLFEELDRYSGMHRHNVRPEVANLITGDIERVKSTYSRNWKIFLKYS